MLLGISPTDMVGKLRDTKRKIIFRSSYFIRSLNPSNEIINTKEIRVLGLKRSGNHAVINWIRHQHTGEVWHLNNIPCQQNPYQFLYRHYPKEHLKQEAFGDFSKKDCLIYSYEDYRLEDVIDPQVEKNHDIYIGKSAVRYDVLVIRDPFNTLASRIKSDMMKTKSKELGFIELWITYAREFIGETNILNQNKICVNYNQWFTDIEYRKELASQLQIKFTDNAFEHVSRKGGGSSFDKREYDSKASQMDVLNRWQFYADNEIYRQMLKNEELLYYSEKIFGRMAGLEEVIASIK